jgi:hypothetical protein
MFYQMNTIKKISCLCTLFVTSFLTPSNVSAQETSATSYNNHVSWGVNYAGGDATFGRGTLMFSTTYERQMLSWLSLEASVQGFAWSLASSFGTFPTALYVINSAAPSISWNSNTLFFDATAMMHPFLGSGLRVGLGPSVRRWESSLLSVGWVSRQVQGFPEETYINVENTQGLVWSLGANAKVEYLIPITQQVDISIRAQGHLLALPFDRKTSSSSEFPPSLFTNQIGGGASLGAFLRIGF